MDEDNGTPAVIDQAQLVDELQTAFCKHFCTNACKANEVNDTCFCTEAGLVAGELITTLIRKREPINCYPPRLVKG